MDAKVKVFRYKGLSRSGEKVKGVIVAPTKEQAEEILKRNRIYVKKISPYPAFLLKLVPLPKSSFVFFFDVLSKLIKAGLQIPEALDYLIRNQHNPKFAYFLYLLKEYILEGYSLPDAMDKTGFVDKEVVEILRVGVESGKLIEVLESLRDYYKEIDYLIKTIKSNSIYPIAVLIGVVGLVEYAPYLFKNLQGLYSMFPKSQFPLFTIVVMKLVNSLSKIVPVLLFVIGILFILGKKYYRENEKVRAFVDSLLLKVPVVKKLIYYSTLYKTFLSMKVLYIAGVPPKLALKMIVNIQPNYHYRKAWEKVYELVNNGEPLYEALTMNRYVPDLYRTLIGVGQRAGELDKVLENIVQLLKEEFKSYIDFIANSFTPFAIMILGIIVGVLLFAMYLPMFKLPELMNNAV